MKQPIVLLLLLAAIQVPAIRVGAVAPDFRVADNELILAHVSSSCPIIYDNDWWTDIPDAAYLWTKASFGQCQLKGNIVSRDMWGWEKGYTYKIEQGVADCRKLLAAGRASGLRNIPDPVLGAAEVLRRPQTGRIEDTQFTRTPGSDLIVTEARKASADKPLLLFSGGPCTTVAAAYLTDPSISDKMIVFQIDGGGYNGSDGWAWEITMKRCRFANWARGYFWDKIHKWEPKRFDELPHDPLGDLLRNYAGSDLAKANQWGDGAWVFYMFDHRCLTMAKDYDGVAITVPKEGNNLQAMEDEFFATIKNSSLPRATDFRTNGVVGYWRFDEASGDRANDDSGNGNDGALRGAPRVNGRLGGAIECKQDALVEVAHASSLDGFKDGITISAWVNRTADNTWNMILSREVKDGPSEYIGLAVVKSKALFSVDPDGAHYQNIKSDEDMPVGEWIHLAGTYDNATFKLYVNGRLVKSAPCTVPFRFADQNPLIIGGNTNSQGKQWVDCFHGRIDDVRLYNRALREDEISKLHAAAGGEK